MKVKALPMADVVSIERMVRIDEEEDEETLTSTGELERGTYALDSLGRVWRQVETVTGLMTEFTEHDGVRRRRAKRTP